jgi:Tol biopolymer transport system component
MCTDVVTDGFRIIMQANGQQFEFHTNQDGTSVIDAAQLQATLKFVVQTINRNIQIVNPNIPLGPTYNPAFNGFLPSGSSILGTAYVLDFSNQPRVVAIDANGSHDLTFIQNPNYGLAIWRGGPGTQPLLAWGTQPSGTSQTSSLQISSPDGSNLETLLTIDRGTAGPIQLVAEFWSADGQSLYFSKEPVGIGGYILFSGASNLYKIDIATKQVSEIIPMGSASSPQTCLDAVSGDYRFVADHCTQNVITVRDLQSGGSTTIQAPTDVTGYRLLGSARFSPDGSQVAFALAKGDPNGEQGWVAVADRTGGVSTLILTGQAGSYYTVLGWLDDQTLLVQSISIGSPNVGNQLFTVGVDGSNPTKVADGTLLTVIDNR